MSRILLPLILLVCCSSLFAEDTIVVEPATKAALSEDAVRAAIRKAIPMIERGAAGSADQRKCFTCHNQGVAVLALTEVAKRGFDIDKENLQRQLQHTWNHLNGGKKGYQEGKGQGGQVVTAGYALWALESGDWKSDETTTAVVHYLAEYQRDRKHWSLGGNRPPSSGSSFTATYLALRALSHYGTEKQSDAIKTRREAVTEWVLDTKPADTEDLVFQLRALPHVDADKTVVQQTVDTLVAMQHANGGWSQKKDMQPDAYATGTVLAALQEYGLVPSNHRTVIAGVTYLIDTQLEDGTWFVDTRAKPFQEYYESGFPHDEDQYISMAASGWATLALAYTLPAAKEE